MKNASIWVKYGYVWITLVLFLGSFAGHWLFGWKAYVSDQEAHNEPIVVSDYVNEMFEMTFENWQSEFLQLMWQVAGLAILFYVGSPQSKEGDERKEEKIDLILKAVDSDGEKRIKELDEKYARK